MSRMTLKTTPAGHVELTYTDAMTDDPVSREFVAPEKFGYVRELTSSDSRQVCERLASTGHTLMATRATLANVIRREYRAMRRAEKAVGC